MYYAPMYDQALKARGKALLKMMSQVQKDRLRNEQKEKEKQDKVDARVNRVSILEEAIRHEEQGVKLVKQWEVARNLVKTLVAVRLSVVLRLDLVVRGPNHHQVFILCSRFLDICCRLLIAVQSINSPHLT